VLHLLRVFEAIPRILGSGALDERIERRA